MMRIVKGLGPPHSGGMSSYYFASPECNHQASLIAIKVRYCTAEYECFTPGIEMLIGLWPNVAMANTVAVAMH